MCIILWKTLFPMNIERVVTPMIWYIILWKGRHIHSYFVCLLGIYTQLPTTYYQHFEQHYTESTLEFFAL